ncbi:hypothetical protein [Lutimonas zeaxanthinifaciens]|uniref:hypothetical protein n=1 Tax=Lutimonas zeaxanthinifaciens TaxID=3060215 RepID=UPI00265D3C7C|nr:hypothetical protein [Lutimonas sp. YSD2104]WKK65787.1 hypothetical protein QZH61_14515 [Lutimonas sp. YSD2104]
MKTNAEIALMNKLESMNLMEPLVQQIQKDARLSGLDFDCLPNISTAELVKIVYKFLLNLIVNDFGAYLNFLYRVDLSEKDLKSIDQIQPEEIAKEVTILLLHREWQKVYLRSKIR